MASWLARVCSPLGIETPGSVAAASSSQHSQTTGEPDNSRTTQYGGEGSDGLPRPRDVEGNTNIDNISNPSDRIVNADVVETSPPTPAEGDTATGIDCGGGAIGDSNNSMTTVAVDVGNRDAVPVATQRSGAGIIAAGYLREREHDGAVTKDIVAGNSVGILDKKDSSVASWHAGVLCNGARAAGENVAAAEPSFDVAIGESSAKAPTTLGRDMTTAATDHDLKSAAVVSSILHAEQGTNSGGFVAAREAPAPPDATGDRVGDATGDRVGDATGDRVGDATGDRVGATTPWLETLLFKASRQQQQHQQKRLQQQQQQQQHQRGQKQQQMPDEGVDKVGPVAASHVKATAATEAVVITPEVAPAYSLPVAKSKSNIDGGNAAASKKTSSDSNDSSSGAVPASSARMLSSSNAATTAGTPLHISVADPSPAAPLLQAILSPSAPTSGSPVLATSSLTPPPPSMSPPQLQRRSVRQKPSSSKKSRTAAEKRRDGARRPASAVATGGGDGGGDGGEITVKSVSPRPAKPKKGRGRAQSLGSKPEDGCARGRGEGKGKGRKKRRPGGGGGGGGGVSGKGGGKGGMEIEILREGIEKNEEGKEGDVAGADFEFDPFASPSRARRRVYKGSEHGKVKFLFPNMSPWRRNKLRFDEESLWSVTDQKTADEISNAVLLLPGVSAETIVVDGTACVGGNAISFASNFDEVWAVEIDRNRFNLLKGNIKKAAGASPTHGRVRFFNDDFLNVLLTEKIEMRERRPVVFLDPPWGGVDYKKQEEVSLSMSDLPLSDVCARAAEAGVRHVLLKVPTNFNLKAFRTAVGSAARVSVHKRNLRKMILVAVDFDRRPEASPASTPPQSLPATPTTPSPVGPPYQQGTLFASLSSSSSEQEEEEQERDTDDDEDFESDSNDSYVPSRDGASGVSHVRVGTVAAAGAAARGLEDYAAPGGSPLLSQATAVLGAQSGAGERGAGGEKVRSPLSPWHDDGSVGHSCAHDGAERNRTAATMATKTPTSMSTTGDVDVRSLGGVENVIPAAAAAATAAIGGDCSSGRPPQPSTLGPGSPEVGYAAAGARKMLKEMLGLDTSGDDHHNGGGGSGMTAALVGMQATTGSDVNLAADLGGVRNEDVTTRTGLLQAESNIDGHEGVGGRDVAREGGGRQAAAPTASGSAATDAVETRRLLKSLLGLEL